uniref:Uncharacterized protein n=1 Tax=Tanacetum cinerariifolium TaxID=118510 RepID=A0A699HYZ6_TANCI|nr:hypothetical protein [Tanacetum cinerariifolium]
MALTFSDTYNMIAYLTKSDASEGFDQIIDFLITSSTKYALTVNPNIYVSCIKQFCSSVSVKKVNDVTRLQALVDRKKVIITEAIIRDAIQLDDAESIDCLPNEEIFTELSRMGAQVGDLSLHSIKYSSPALTQKVFANMRRAGKGFSGVDTPLFEGMIVAQQADKGAADVDLDVLPTPPPSPIAQPPSPQQQPQPSQPSHDAGILMDILHTLLEIDATMDADEDVILKDVAAVAKEVEVEKTAEIEENADVQGRQAESQAQIYQIDLEHSDKVLSIQDDELEPFELKEVVEVVTTAKLMTEVVTAASATITAAATPITAAILTTAPSAARGKKGVVIRDLEETEPKPLKKQAQIKQDEAYARELEAELNKTINWDDVIDQVQRKEKEDNAVMRYQALKRKPQTESLARKNMMIYLRNMVGFKMEYFKGMSYDDIRPIFEKYFNSNVAFLEKTKEQLEEEESRALKRKTKSQAEKAAKKQKLDKREDMEVLWQLVKERFASLKPKNFSDDFMLTTLTYMLEKPDV